MASLDGGGVNGAYGAMESGSKYRTLPNYTEELEKFKRFISNYREKGKKSSSYSAPSKLTPKYVTILEKVAQRKCKVIELSLDDVLDFEGDEEFVHHIERNARRYISLVSDAIDSLLPSDAVDVLRNQPHERGGEVDASKVFPAELMRRYEVHLRPRTGGKVVAIREVGARQIGRLVQVRGMITRVTDVKPLMSVATYTCDVLKARKFMPLSDRGKLFMQTRGSKFVKFQTAKMQELPDQVPIGHIPRSMTVHLCGELTRSAMPGDQLTVSGMFLPTPYTGLTADTYLEGMHIHALVEQAVEDDEIYDKLAKSIAPEIFGLVDIKKALLLQLVGGVTKKLSDGMRIRGVAKSQLLKHIAKIAPRAVFTTGKAAVMKDTVSGEMVLEGGALFDKMEEGDRTAIHEVMEQQTVSIAKAILAAANPLMGRYNKKKSPSANINLPAALLNRLLANHIAYVHRCNCHPDLSFTPLSAKFIRAYIGQARRCEPFIPAKLSSYIVEEYVNMRQRDLLSILRLSQALARLQFSNEVTEEDVDEAIRLVHTCKAQLLEDDERRNGQDATSAIYLSILSHIRTAGGEHATISFSRVEPLLLAKGYNQDEIRETIEQYEELDVFRLNASRTRITLVTAQ
eukprot:GSMAST32.ASY1.ANO1.2746.1 assembled CDS